ncbi:hypothetical protein AArcMg_1469 [Natrarchaeobaculum sulfurireducens]|uniref:BppU N-terminal domain-containing protein n=2 Tax=Natrarchaeobaculum sulfurireducens TaxID=2044521 RepID=A0A346PPN7_9EURY|nr:hypothetical protein AArcMg_1469 [Natrarchaeobaculum sulfurireducens]
MKAGDTTPSIEATLTDAHDQPVDLGDAETTEFELRDRHGETMFAKPVEITDAITGEVEYDWDEEDTEEAGDYRGQFVVEFENGDRLTTPTEDWIDVYIERA